MMKNNMRAVLILSVAVFLIQPVSGMYHQKMGRFMQQDPLGVRPNLIYGYGEYSIFQQYSDGLNIYYYMLNNPLQGSDPLGLSFVSSSAQWTVDMFETKPGKFVSCMGECLEGTDVLPRLGLGILGGRVFKTGKGARAATKSIWQIKSVRRLTGSTIKGGMKVGRVGVAGILVGGLVDGIRLGICAKKCSENKCE